MRVGITSFSLNWSSPVSCNSEELNMSSLGGVVVGKEMHQKQVLTSPGNHYTLLTVGSLYKYDHLVRIAAARLGR